MIESDENGVTEIPEWLPAALTELALALAPRLTYSAVYDAVSGATSRAETTLRIYRTTLTRTGGEKS
ncbi:hypothetical protein ABH935_005353 [Catenulispora sp. GAS73]|uniref:hypothetical protein n=1 Tax=Catenulispora sp. GAS73 TaxID=3156269 RepID=UPI0035144D62